MKHRKKVAIVVAHPDDETLWAGGTLLSHPEWELLILCLCRKNDPDRAAKFKKTAEIFNGEGIMDDLDDGPLQTPQSKNHISELILKNLPERTYDLIITHNPLGEYTRHRRHEEIGKAVLSLWMEDKLCCNELLIFAYEDGNSSYFPKALSNADLYYEIPDKFWQQKYHIMTNIYGFNPDSWEAKTVPTSEAFWRFTTKESANAWLKKNSIS
ncbi:PIG-L deacetylase family protein [Pedobacter gandavensis]|uniref:PIG-L deacetylase family protein n=1 Tax=Pedobacter gandavensis TaxID=2679963 RepID=UPI00292E8F87|nr:PIG-L family deacetylase [Pedobacter gandavensis]